MMTKLAPPDADALERFRALLAQRLGLIYPEQQTEMLAELLASRACSHRLEAESYLNALEACLLPAELDALAPTLTTGETYFFRNIEQFHALRELVLPGLLAERRQQGRGLNVLSAGCASGEELYTIAMVAQDLAPAEQEVSLLGVDLNPQALKKAREGLYTAWSLRETPPGARERWFLPAGAEFRLRPELRAQARFEPLNLSAEAPEFWQPGRFDVIFARNVLMYFSRPALEAAVARISGALAPGGYLFLGHSESLRELARDFKLCHTHGTFYYQRKPLHGESALLPHAPGDWFEAIRRAAERVRGLTAERPQPPAPAPTPLPVKDPAASALALFGQERFEAAAQALAALDATTRGQAEAQLLLAMLHVHNGELQQAEDLAHALLTREPHCAAAHYVIALCRESSGELSAAVNRYAQAALLDHGFALPHLQLGRLARQRGDRKTQKHELSRAATLLAQESKERLLMFGGGFDRQALLALCRADGGIA